MDKIWGSFIGLGQHHDQGALTQAVMEGVAFSLGDCAQALRGTGAVLKHLVAVGGGTHSPFWLKTVANVLDCTLTLNPCAEHASALGAARLGIAASQGRSVGVISAQSMNSESCRQIHPQSHLVPAYQKAMARYQNLFLQIREIE